MERTEGPPRGDDPPTELARLQAALESVNDGLYAVDTDWRVVLFNRAAEEYFNLKRDDVLGRQLWDIFPQGRNQDYERICNLAMFEGVTTTWEARSAFHPDRTVELRMAPMAGGGIAVALNDITARKKAEAALRASEARLNLATQASGLGVWEWRLNQTLMVFSPRAREIWGFTEDQPISGDLLIANTLEPDRTIHQMQSRRALDPVLRESAPSEFRIRRGDGQVRWIRVQGEAVFRRAVDGSDRAYKYVGIVEDVTEQKDAERSLRASEARLRLAVDAGRMAVWEVDVPTGRWNITPEVKRILGFADHETPDLAAVQARYAPGELERMQQYARSALGHGDRFLEFEFQYLWPGGEVRWIMLRADVIVGETGQAVRALGVLMDITTRKRDEERLRLLAREVDHRANNLLAVVQSTVALTRAPDVVSLKHALSGRIAALARAHQLLAEGRWQGADLERLVREELVPYDTGEPGRLQLDGESCALTPKTAQSVAMVLHELATNAAKYGALSSPAGQVHVAWRGDVWERGIELEWTEDGGPPVHAPARRGLGLAMIERALDGLEGGRTVIEWRPSGLVCRLRVPPEPLRPGP